MRKILKLCLLTTVYLLLLVMLSLVLAIYWSNTLIQQQSKALEIEILDWQFPKFEPHQIYLEQLKLRYQKNYQIRVNGLKITSSEALLKTAQNLVHPNRTSDAGISKLNIEHLQIQLLEPLTPSNNAQPVPINSLIKSIQQQLMELSNNSTYNLIPKNIDIQELTFLMPCPSSTLEQCEISSKLSIQPKLNLETLSGTIKLQAHDTEYPTLQVRSEADFRLPLKQPVNTSQFSINSQFVDPKTINLKVSAQTQSDATVTTLKVDTETLSDFPQVTEINPANKLRHAFSDDWQKLFDMYHRWSPFQINLQQLASQISPFLPAGSFSLEKPEFKLSTQTQIPLSSLLNASIKDLTQRELSTEFSAQINRPVTLPNSASVSGSLKGNVTVHNNQVSSYSVQANAVATDFNKPQWFVEQNWTFDTVGFTLHSKQSFEQKSSKQLPFKLNLHSLPQTKTSTSSMSIEGKGLISLEESPSLSVEKAHIKLSNTKLKLNPQIAFKNLRANVDLTAQLNLMGGDIQINQAIASTKLIQKQHSLAINQLQINHLNIHIPEFKNLTDSLSLNAQTLTLDGDYINADLKLQQLTTTLKQLQVQNDHQHEKKLSVQYQTNVGTLTHQQLKPQSWQTTGTLSSNFKGLPDSINAIQFIKLKGELQNTSGVRADYLANLTPKEITIDWNLADQYLLAGNPIKKTLVNWPKLFNLSSGKLSANGNLTLNPQALLTDKPFSLLDAIKAQSHLEFSGLDGIYNETAFSQLDLTAKLQLEKAQLHTDVTALRVQQLNHGLIVGPIDVIAQTQTPIENWRATKIILQKAEVGIFEGKAHLDSKIIHLDKEIHGNLHLDNVNLQALLLQYPTAELYGTGRLQGELPFSLNLTNQAQKTSVLRIANGEISASKSGGILQYQANSAGLKQIHKSMETLLTVLEDFHYTILDSQVSLDEQQKLRLKLRLEGNNPKVENGRQVNLNIQIEEDLPALITSMQITNQINSTIQQRIQEKLQMERALKPSE